MKCSTEVGERAMRLLESLTPGGSEFFNDPERCAKHIRENRDSGWEAAKKFKRELDQARKDLEATKSLGSRT